MNTQKYLNHNYIFNFFNYFKSYIQKLSIGKYSELSKIHDNIKNIQIAKKILKILKNMK